MRLFNYQYYDENLLTKRGKLVMKLTPGETVSKVVVTARIMNLKAVRFRNI